MKTTIEIRTGQSAVAHKDSIIRTDSIGSCIVIALYDEVSQVGGLAHAMLPAERGNQVGNGKKELQAKYADQAIDLLIEEIINIGGDRKNLEARLIGGARMFKILSGDVYGIGYQNIESAKEKLKQLEIPITKEATGGTIGRMVEFNIESGIIDVITKI